MDSDLLMQVEEHTMVPHTSSDVEQNCGVDAKYLDVANDSYSVDINTDDTLSIEDEIKDNENETIKREDLKKVNVMDIFKNMKPLITKKEQENNRQLKSDTKKRNIDQLETKDASERILHVINKENSQKIYKSGLTAKDLLTGQFKPKVKKVEPIDRENSVNIDSETEDKNESIVMIPSDEPQDHHYKAKSGITALDILTGTKKPKELNEVTPCSEIVELLSSDEDTLDTGKLKKRKYRKRNKQPVGSLLVSFKYKPQHKRLAEIEEKIRQSTNRTTSMKDMFKSFNKKKELLVTLKIQPEALETIGAIAEPFHERAITKPGAKSFLDILSHKPQHTKANVYKLKSMPIPELRRDNMHVKYREDPIIHRSIQLRSRNAAYPIYDFDYGELKSLRTKHVPSDSIAFQEYIGDLGSYALAKNRVQDFESNIHYKRFIDLLAKKEPIQDTWVNAFKPEKAADILIDHRVIYSIKQWLSNSFNILSKRTKRVNLNSKKTDNDMDGFLVDDEYDENTEDETYIPLIIISGPEGVGKSAAVYTLVQEASGYVHEINASQYRGRKDIMASLKEMSTTQLVYQNQETIDDSEFQKGIILFEDVDILFEQDKGFWSVLESLLMISRRPLVVTCNDLSVIPENILAATRSEQQVYEFKKQKRKELEDYLYLVGLSNKLDVQQSVLDHIIDSSNLDLRKSLNNLEILCKNDLKFKITTVKLQTVQTFKPSMNSISDISDYSSLVDIFSVADLVENATYSLIEHEFTQNELVAEEVSLRDDELRATILPFEFNAAQLIRDVLPSYPFNSRMYNITHIKRLDQKYYKSKLKIFKRLTRGAIISSMQLFTFDEEMYDKSVFDILPNSKYVIEVSPFFREFARYDARVDEYNEALMEIETNRSTEDLKATRPYKKRKFEMVPQTLLYGPFKNWES